MEATVVQLLAEDGPRGGDAFGLAEGAAVGSFASDTSSSVAWSRPQDWLLRCGHRFRLSAAPWKCYKDGFKGCSSRRLGKGVLRHEDDCLDRGME